MRKKFYSLLLLFAFFVLISTESYSQCSLLSGNTTEDFQTSDVCAPTTVTWQITFEFISPQDPNRIAIFFRWDNSNGTLVDNPIPSFGNTRFTATASYTYPAGGNCSYVPFVLVRFDTDNDGIFLPTENCLSSRIFKTVSAWSDDNSNSGVLAINPVNQPVCYDDSTVGFQFQDATFPNCDVSVEPDRPNQLTRWVQFIYGTGPGPHIPLISIDTGGGTVQLTDAAGNLTAAAPFAGPIIEIPPLVLQANLNELTYPISHPAAGISNIGDLFEVTLRNWNTCNPYDTLPFNGLPPTDAANGDFPSITTTANLEIIGPSPATAGPDQGVCGNSTTLAGNVIGTGTGQWTQISGPGTITFGNINNPTTTATISGSDYGTYLLEWAAVLGTCNASSDTVEITFFEPPSSSNAGPDQDICGNSTTLAANNPAVGSGEWFYISGPAGYTISNSLSRNSAFSSTSFGTYVLEWRIDNGACPDQVDQVQIVFEEAPTAANAGPDDTTACGDLTYNLQGNNPTVGTGTWSKVGGPPGVINYTPDANTFNAQALFPQHTVGAGVYRLRWTISTGTGICPDAVDFVDIRSFESPTVASTGGALNLCGLTTTLNGNTATIGQGTWTQDSGPGTSTFVNANDPNTNVTVSVAGNYVFRWTIGNGNCPSTSATTAVQFDPPPTTPNAGADDSICNILTYGLNGNTITNGTGTWIQFSGPAGVSFSPDANTPGATATFPGQGVYGLIWESDLPPNCPVLRDTVFISVFQFPSPASIVTADPTSTCNLTGINISAVFPVIGFGTWYQISGPGPLTFVDSSNNNTTVDASQSGTYELLWEVTNGPCSPPQRDTLTLILQSPSPSLAGNDTTVCAAFDTLNANTPLVGTGTWSVVAQPGGGTFTFDDPNKPNARFDITNGVYGTYTLRWTIANAGCIDETDDVIISFFEDPTPAVTVADFQICADTAQLGANALTVGTGQWQLVSGAGPVTFAPNANTENAVVSIPPFSMSTVYQFEWTTSNGVCLDSRDTLTVTFFEISTTPDAGTNIEVCNSSTSLNGNAITVGTGTWTQVGGPSALTISSPNSETSAINIGAFVNDSDTFLLEWSSVNGNCVTLRDTVQVIFHDNPTASAAGTDINICADTAQLGANLPAVGQGQWSQVSGTGAVSFDDVNNPVTIVRAPVFAGDSAVFVLQWRISNGTCPVSDDSVQVVFYADPTVANAGADDSVCALTYSLNGNFDAIGTGTWSQISGPGTSVFANANQFNSDVTVSLYGTYSFEWAIGNGPCIVSRDTVSIRFDEFPSSANAGNDDTVCALTTTLAANNPAVGTGVWTVTSTPSATAVATLADSSLFNTGVSVNEVGAYTFQWTISNGTCVDSSDQVTIIFASSNANTGIAGDTTVCLNDANLVYTVPFVAGTTYEWFIPAGVTLQFGGGINDNFAVLTFPTAGLQELKVLPTNNFGCASDTQTTDVTVYTYPVADAGIDAALCSGDTAVLGGAPTATGGSGFYNYTWSPTSGLDDANAANPLATPSFSRTYFLTVQDSIAGCLSQVDTVNVAVNPSPSSTLLGLTPFICEGDTGILQILFGVGIGPFAVEISNGVDTTLYPSLSSGDSVFVTPDSTLTYQVVSILDSATLCNGSVFNGAPIINVRPLPTAVLSTLDTVICEGEVANLNLTVSGPSPQIYTIQYAVNGLDTTIVNLSGSSTTIPVFPDSSSLYTLVSITDNFRGCVVNAPSSRFTDSVFVKVDSLPRANIVGGDTICAGDSAALVVNITEGDAPYVITIQNLGTITNYQSGDTIWVSPASTTIYSVLSAADSNGCTTTSSSLLTGSVTILVNPLPVANLTGTNTICFGDSSALQINVTSGTNPFIVVLSNGDTINNYANGSPYFVSPGTTTSYTLVSVEDSNGCYTSAPSSSLTGNPQITVNPLPTAQIESNDTICAGDNVVLTFSFTGTAPYTFTFRDNNRNVDSTLTTSGTSTTRNVTVSPDSTTIYSLVSVIGANGCIDSVGNPVNPTFGDTVQIVVDSLPVATIVADAPTDTICNGDVAYLYVNVSTGPGPYTLTINNGVGTISNYNSGDSIAVNPAVTTNYQITSLLDQNGCSVNAGHPNIDDTATIVVNPLPAAILSGTATICFGDTTPLVASIAPGISPFRIVINDGTQNDTIPNYISGTNIPVSPAVTTTYNLVSVLDSFGCYTSAPSANLTGTPQVTVNPLPTVQINQDDTICFGDNVTLNFSFTGTSPFTVIYKDNTTGINDTVSTVGTSTSANVIVSPDSTTLYTLVSVQGGNGCIDSINNPVSPGFGDTVQIVVDSLPVATIVADAPTDTICNGDVAYLYVNISTGPGPYTLTINNGVGTISNYNSGDSIAVNPAVTTNYQITSLLDQNGCSVSAGHPNIDDTATIFVNPLPAVALALDTNRICFGDTANLVLTLNTGAAPLEFVVNPNINDTITNFDPLTDVLPVSPNATTTYSLNYVRDANACVSVAPSSALTGTPQLNINPLPTLQVADSTTICLEDAVILTFSMTGSAPYTFTYRDELTGTDSTITTTGTITTRNVTEFPLDTTLYTLVSITDAQGCTDSINNAPINPNFGDTVLISVNPLPITTLNVIEPTDTICFGDNALFTVNVTNSVESPGPYTVEINGGIGVINNYNSGDTITFSPNTTANYNIVSLTDANGCSVLAGHPNLPDTVRVVVNPLPVVELRLDDNEICLGDSARLFWRVPLGSPRFDLVLNSNPNDTIRSVSSTDSIWVSPTDTTTYSIIYFSDSFGCTVVDPSSNISGSPTLIVNPLPTASLSINKDTVCFGETTQITFNLTGPNDPYTYQIDTTGNILTGFNIIDGSTLSYILGVGPHDFKLIEAIDDKGCVATIGAADSLVEVFVHALPTASISGDTSLCDSEPFVLNFNLTGNGPLNVYFNGGGNNYVRQLNPPTDTAIVSLPASVTPYFFRIDSVVDSNSPEACLATDITGLVTIQVYDRAEVEINSFDTTICQGDQAILSFDINGGRAPFEIDLSTDGVTVDTTLTNIADGSIFLVRPNDTTTYTILDIRETLTAEACTGTIGVKSSFTVNVNPLPTANLTLVGPDTKCFGDSITINIQFTGQAPYDLSLLTNYAGPISINDIQTNDTTFNVSSSFPGFGNTINLFTLSDGHTPTCSVIQGDPQLTGNVVFNLNDLPTASLSPLGLTSVCRGDSADLLVVVSQGDLPYTVYISDGSTNYVDSLIITSGNTGIIQVAPQITSTFQIDSVIDGSLPESCRAVNISGTVQITVQDRPTVGISGIDSVCSFENSSFQIQAGGTGPWLVTYTNGIDTLPAFVSTSPQTVTVFNPPVGLNVYSIVSVSDNGTVPSCPADSLTNDSAYIYVNALPTASLSGDTTICNGDPLPIYLDFGVTNGPFDVTVSDGTNNYNFTGLSPQDTVLIPYPGPGFFIYRLTAVTDAQTNCQPLVTTGQAIVQVRPIPIVSMSVIGSNVICGSDTVGKFIQFNFNEPNIYDIEILRNGVVVDTLFAIGNGTIFPAPGLQVGNNTYSIGFANYSTDPKCNLTVANNVSIFVNADPTITIQDDDTICVGNSVTLTLNATGLPNYTVQYIGSTGIQTVNSANTTFTINVNPVITTSYRLLSITDGNGCSTNNILPSDSTEATVVVNQLPTAQLKVDGFFSNNVTFCEEDTVALQYQLTGNGPFNVVVNDNLGNVYTRNNVNNLDTLLLINPIPPVGSTTQYFLTQVLDNNNPACAPTSLGNPVTITVDPLPTATISGDTTICDGALAPLTINFTGTGPWTFRYFDGTLVSATQASNLPTYTLDVLPNATTTYTIFDVVDQGTSNQCAIDSTHPNISGTATVVVEPPVNADFTFSSDDECGNPTFSFTDQTTPAAVYSYSWDFGDTTTSTQQNPTHQYSNTGNNVISYTVKMIATSTLGCVDSAQKVIQVRPEIIADAVADITEGCSPLDVNFTSNTIAAGYEWDFENNGANLIPNNASVSHQFVNNGLTSQIFNVYHVTLNQFGCSDTLIIPITVHPKPQPTFTANPNQQNWPPDPVIFTNGTPNLNNNTYLWSFGDTANGTSTQISPTYDFGTFGNFTVKLTATSQNGCIDSTTRLVVIFPDLPIADFSGETSGCVPFAYTFTNTSTFALSSKWVFSDGSEYFSENVTKTFFDPGVYDVKLIVTGISGFKDSIEKFAVVTGYTNPSANFFSRDSVFVGLNEINFSNESRNATDFFWDFGDGTTSDERSPTKNYRFEGEYEVTLIAFNTINDSIACTDTASKFITVQPVGDIIVPNAFTPVEGGPTGGAVNPFDRFNNTVFYPVIRKEFVDLKFEVFNRWGEPIFQSTTINIGWDGYVNGEPAPQGVYIYRVQVEFADGTKETTVGDVTLLR